MIAGDSVAASRFPCTVAQDAQTACHTHLTNGLVNIMNETLAKRIRNEERMRALEALVRSIVQRVRGFSGAHLVDQLEPLAKLPATQRENLASALDHAFEACFVPNRVAARLSDQLDLLLARIRDVVSNKAGGESLSELESIREAARGLAEELRSLPKGYWLPDSRLVNTDRRTA